MGGRTRAPRAAAITAATVMAIVVALLGGLVDAPAGASATTTERATTGGRAASFAAYGSTQGLNHVLHRGCHPYQFRYSVKPPTQDWLLETVVVDPRGNELASDIFLSNDDPSRKLVTYRLCKRITRAGVFRIRAKLTYTDGYAQYVGYLKTSRFRLCPPPQRPGPRPCSRAQQTP